MVSDVLLLSYLDKISLILTGEAGQALACLYSEARLYKGARMAPISQSTTTRSTGNISVGEESQPLQHTWNSKGFVLSRSNSLLHNSLHFQHLMKTKGFDIILVLSFKTLHSCDLSTSRSHTIICRLDLSRNK
jgi:hypothetical protein